MPRYVAAIAVTSETEDAEAGLSGLADSAEDQATRITDTFADSTDTVAGQFASLSDDGSRSLSSVADDAETSAGRITEGFTKSAGKVTGLFDDLAAKGDEKSGLLGASFDKSFGTIADSAETATGKITGTWDTLVGDSDERAGSISAIFERNFTLAGTASEGMVAKLGTSLDAMVTETDLAAGKISTRLDAAYEPKVLPAGKLTTGVEDVAPAGVVTKEAATTEQRTVTGATIASSATGTAGKVAEAKYGEDSENAAVSGASKLGKYGLLAGVAAIAASIDAASKYQTALVPLETAVKATGISWKGYQPELQGAEQQGVSRGFTGTETVGALATLTGAFGNAKEALGKLTLAENLARQHNISLGESAQDLAKVQGGTGARIIAQWGYQADVGSAKLHSIQAAQQTVTKATLAYKEAVQAAGQTSVTGSQDYKNAVLSEKIAANAMAESGASGSAAVANALAAQNAGQAEVASGQVRGAAGVALLTKNQMALVQAVQAGGFKNTAGYLQFEKASGIVGQTEEKSLYAQMVAPEKVQGAKENLAYAKEELAEDKEAIPKTFSLLSKKSAGASNLYDQTLPGELKTAGAEADALGVALGTILIPKVEELGHGLIDVVGFLEKHKTVAEALGVAAGVVLTGATAVYAEQKAHEAITATTKAAKDLGKLLHIGGQGAATAEGKVGTGSATSAETASKISGAAGTMESAGKLMLQAANKMTAAAGEEETAGGEQESAGKLQQTAAGEEETAGGEQESAGKLQTTTAGTEEETAGSRELAGGAEEAGGFGGGGAGGAIGKVAIVGTAAIAGYQLGDFIAREAQGKGLGADAAKVIYDPLADATKSIGQLFGAFKQSKGSLENQQYGLNYAYDQAVRSAGGKIGNKELTAQQIASAISSGPVARMLMEHDGPKTVGLLAQIETQLVKGIVPSQALEDAFYAALRRAEPPRKVPNAVTHQYNMPNTTIVSNDPADMGRKLDQQTKRKSLVRT